MPIEPPSSHGAKPALTRALAASLTLKVGEQVNARVSKIQPVNSAQRQWLNQQANIQAKTLMAQGSDRPDNINALTGRYRQLVQQNVLNLARLVVKGKTLVTLTDQPLIKGQNVQLQLDANQQLLLTAKSKPQHAGNPALQTFKAPHSGPPKAALLQALREIVPRRQTANLLSHLPQLIPAVQHLPHTSARHQLTRALQQLQAAALTLSPQPSGDAIKKALTNSGSLLESRLAGALQTPKQTQQAVAHILTTDSKAALLQIANISAPAKANTPQPLLNTPTPASEPQARLNLTTEQLPSLAQLLGGAAATHSSSSQARALQTQLVMLIHQLTLSSLAKVRGNQLQPDSSRTQGRDGLAPAPLHFDIPVRHDGGVQSAHIRIHSEPDEREGSADTRRREKVWQVQLHLNPPVIGDFYAQLKYRNQHLHLTFWAPEAQTLQEARKKFADIQAGLSASGIEVESVHFRRGKPEKDNNRVGYALVDIKT